MKKFLQFKHRLLLALLTAFLAVPQAWADDVEVADLKSLKNAISNADNAPTIKLTQDIENVTEAITIDKSLTLDLNGKKLSGTLSGTNGALSFLSISNKATDVTIKSSVAGGKIEAKTTDHSHEFYAIYQQSNKLTLESGTIYAENKGSGSAGAVNAVVNTTLNVIGATLEGHAATGAYGINGRGANWGDTHVNISGGAVIANATNGSAYAVRAGGNLNITGGTIKASTPNGCYGIYLDEYAKATITEATITSTSDNNGFGVYVGHNGETSATATIGGGSIAATVTNSVVYGIWSEGVTEIAGGNISAEATISNAYGLFANNGTTTVSSDKATVSAKANTAAYVANAANATLNLNAGAFISNATTQYAYDVNATGAAATINVNGGSYKVTSPKSAYVMRKADGNINVKGGFYTDKSNVAEFLADGYGFYSYSNSTYNYEVAQNVAQIVTTNYKSLQDAFDAVPANGTQSTTITLLVDEDATGYTQISNKNVILDLNSHTFAAHGTNTTLYPVNSTLQIKNGTIKQDSPKGNAIYAESSNLTLENDVEVIGPMAGYGIYYRNVGYNRIVLNINGATVKSRGWAVCYCTYDGDQINIDGATLEGVAGVFGNGTEGYSKNIVTIKNSTINAAYDKKVDSLYSRDNQGNYNGDWALAQALYFPNNDCVKVVNTKINVTGGQGVVARAGTVVLENDNITVSGTKVGTAGDKNVDLQSAVVVFDATSPNYPGLKETHGVAKVNITGGTYICDATVEAVQLVRDFNSTNSGKYIEVSGGTFSSAINEDYCADNFVPTLVGGKYTVATADSTNAIYYIAASDGANGKKQYLTGSKLNITDGAYYSFNVPAALDGMTKNITYTRNFKNTSIQPWFVPFAVDAKDYQDSVKFYYIDFDNTASNGLPQYYEETDTVKANTPYFIQAINNGNVTFTATNATISKTSDLATYSVSNSESNKYTFIGIYEKKVAQSDDSPWYLMSGGRFYKASYEHNNSLNPFRFYMTIENSGPASPAAVDMIFDDDITGINSTTKSVYNEDGNAVIYNLQGQRVTTPGKGIYIINGKKVLIK